MTSHVNSQPPQLLDQAPNFGAAGGNVLGNLSAADDNGGVLHEGVHNPPQAKIGLLDFLSTRSTFWVRLSDVEIIREPQRNNNRHLSRDDAHADIGGVRGMGEQADRDEINAGIGVGTNIFQANASGALD